MNDEFNLYEFMVKQLLKSALILMQFFLAFIILEFTFLSKAFHMLRICNPANRKNHQCKKIQIRFIIIVQIKFFNLALTNSMFMQK